MLSRIGSLIADWIDRNSLTEVVFSEEETYLISRAWYSMPANYLEKDDLTLCDAFKKVLESKEYRVLIGRAECYLTFQERKALQDLIDGYCEFMADNLPNLPTCYEAEYIGWYDVASQLINKLR